MRCKQDINLLRQRIDDSRGFNRLEFRPEIRGVFPLLFYFVTRRNLWPSRHLDPPGIILRKNLQQVRLWLALEMQEQVVNGAEIDFCCVR